MTARMGTLTIATAIAGTAIIGGSTTALADTAEDYVTTTTEVEEIIEAPEDWCITLEPGE